MIKKLFPIIILTIAAILSVAESIAGTVIIKIDIESELFSKWQSAGKNYNFPEFSGLIDQVSSKPLIREKLLEKASEKLYGSSNLKSGSMRNINSLSGLCVINYKEGPAEEISASKLRSHPDIIYAEPFPRRNFSFIPNDPYIDFQPYLDSIRAYKAWDEIDAGSEILIGIVDTGIDFDHVELKNRIYNNPGETGEDKDGNDKRTNGIDDDENGFIDDWRGWDFAGADGNTQDNDPYPGNPHGTHVAGISAAEVNNETGIAGVSPYAKLLPVKVGLDFSFGTSVYNAFEGLLYAAVVGSDIINCSWGGENSSEAEAEIVALAIDMGSVIVAAAGNDGDNINNYPAAYKDVISVASLDGDNKKSSFSNYSYDVDISTYGRYIYSTVPNDEYDYMDGTSMASPVLAGIAALVKAKFPDYSPVQIGEQIKATADDIYYINDYYKEFLGKGKANAYRAVTETATKSVIISDYKLIDDNGDGIIEEGEKVTLDLIIHNVLAGTDSIGISISPESFYQPYFTEDEIYIGSMNPSEIKTIPAAFEFTVPDKIPYDYMMKFKIIVGSGTKRYDLELLTMTVKPSYRTFDNNNLSVTINSAGNIAYNDYPDNLQGNGFRLRNSSDLLYEGALMVGVSPERVSNGARGEDQLEKVYDFVIDSVISEKYSPDFNAWIGITEFSDMNDENDAGIKVLQKVFQSVNKADSNFIILTYDIINTSGFPFDSLYAGLFFDWDIGTSGSNNRVSYDIYRGFGYCKNLAVDSLPITGAKLLTQQPLNYFAMDNDGNGGTNPGIWDGFTTTEKWNVMSGGMARLASGITDVSMVISAGPVNMRADDTVRVSFAVLAGKDADEIVNALEAAKAFAAEHDLDRNIYSSPPSVDSLISIYPNPSPGDIIRAKFGLANSSEVSIEIFDMAGAIVKEVLKKNFPPDIHTIDIDLNDLPVGAYWIRIKTESEELAEKIIINR